MTIKATFQDYYSIESPSKEILKEFRDYYANGGTKKLIIDMEATHSAVPLNNPRFYIPSRMKSGTSTIKVGDSPMKILKHHDPHSDPIGKAIYREYVDTIPEDLVGNPDVLTLLSDTATMKEQLRSMRNLKRAGVLDREGYKGLGYIRLQAEVSDELSVKQLEDGLFDAISTNFDSPEEVYCSICGQNIAKDGWCEHEIGEAYFADGMEEEGDMQFTCQFIPGLHLYKEASLINFKGDQHASIKIVDTKNKDNNQTVYMLKDSIESGHSTFQFKDSVEEDPMKIKINGKEVTLSDAEQKIFDLIKGLKSDMKDEEIYSLVQDATKVISSDKFISDKQEAEIDDEKAVLYVVQDLLMKDQELKANEICDGIRKELQAMKDEKLLSDEEFEAADAKISEEGLSKLPESIYCGPEKTFPVPDSAHVIAAKRFLDKYEGPGNKISILAMISIKEKAYGTDSEEDDNQKDDKKENQEIEITKLDKLIASAKDEELRTLWHSVEAELIKRNKVLTKPCSDCAVKEAKVETAKKELGEALDNLSKSENIVNVLRGELKRAYSDFEDQVTEYVKIGAELHTAKVEKLALIGVLTQKYDSLESASKELKDSDIEKESIAIMDKFDIKTVTEKINDGMSNNKPNGTVDDPTHNSDDSNEQLPNALSKAAEAAIENIKDCLIEGNISGARRIYDTMNSFGMFPKEITFQSLSADKQSAE